MTPADASDGDAGDPHVDAAGVDPSGVDPAGVDPDEGRRYPSTIGGMFYLLVLATMVAGLVLVYVEDWRLGIRVLASGLLGAAALRLVLPQRDAGMLAVRHRFVDVLILLAMGLSLIFLTGSIPDQPL